MTDRDQVAREVLTEAVLLLAGSWDNAAHIVELYRDGKYPAPAAPVTVTVEGVTYKRDEEGWWIASEVGSMVWIGPRSDSGYMLDRIAADARRIEELERERDEARRELEEVKRDAVRVARGCLDYGGGYRSDETLLSVYHHGIATVGNAIEAWAGNANDPQVAALRQAATSQGEGLGAPASTSDEAPKSEVTGGGIAAASPAPIPLGAVVVVPGESGSPYTYSLGGWIASHGDPYPYDDDSPWTFALTALYRATHPVADRATVERVADAIARNFPEYMGTAVAMAPDRALSHARAALRALGYTIQEGT